MSIAPQSELAWVRKHVDDLAGKFDSVQVFVTRHDPTTGSTVSVQMGEGNWFARIGHVSAWVQDQYDDPLGNERVNEGER